MLICNDIIVRLNGERLTRPIPSFSNYLAHTDGEIISLNNGPARFISQAAHRGYQHVQVKRSVDGKRKQFKLPVHQLIAAAFHGPRPGPEQVTRHLDGDRLNNHPRNLRWGTPRENYEDSLRHGTAIGQRLTGKYADAHPRTILKTVDVERIKQSLAEGTPVGRLARDYGVSTTAIYRIKHGKRDRQS